MLRRKMVIKMNVRDRKFRKKKFLTYKEKAEVLNEMDNGENYQQVKI